MKKRRHHYVWQHYLKPWTCEGKIACKHADSVFTTQTTNIAVEKDFYRVQDLTDTDRNFISVLMQGFAPHLRKAQEGWLPMFTAPAALRRAFGGQDASVDAYLEELAQNAEEDLYAKIESAAADVLSQLQTGTRKFFSDRKEFQTFVYYLALQNLRTPSFRNRLKLALQDESGSKAFRDVNADGIAGIVRHIAATSIATHFIVERRHCGLTLMETTEDEFITGDQPVLNTYATNLDPAVPPTKLRFYYPISPSRAILFGDVRDDPLPESIRLEKEEVAYYNGLIAGASQSQIYGRSEQVLRTFIHSDS